MADEPVPTSIVDALKDVLAKPSDTLTTYTAAEPKTSKIDNSVLTEQPPAPSAPLRTPENDPNYKLWQEAFERTGDEKVLINTDLSPETISAAANLLVQSPEFKDYIGQYALSNDVNKNLDTINQAINSQKRYTEDMSRETDGDIFKSNDAYFIQRIISGLNQTGQADDFFNQLRDKINTEILQKIENKEQVSNNQTQPSSNQEATNTNEQELKDDAFSKTKKLFNEREGELVEDLTTDEAWNEMRRILGSPEYQRAQTEELGYDTNKGHPDPEIRTYQAEMEKWRKQLPHPEFFEPEKPKNYEERLKQPKIEYDNLIKKGATHEDALNSVYSQFTQQQITPSTQTEVNSNQNQQTIPSTQTETKIDEKPQISPSAQTEINSDNFSKVVPEQTTNLLEDTYPTLEQANYDTTENLTVQSELPSNELFSQVEETTDTTSEEILANTEKTNSALLALTQILATFIQNTGGQLGQAQIPVPVPTNQSSNNTPIGTDAGRTANQGLITGIRSKFIYTV